MPASKPRTNQILQEHEARGLLSQADSVWWTTVQEPLLQGLSLDQLDDIAVEDVATRARTSVLDSFPGATSTAALVIMVRREFLRALSVTREQRSYAAFSEVPSEIRDRVHRTVLDDLSVKDGHMDLDPARWGHVAGVAREIDNSARELLVMDLAYGVRAQDYAAYCRSQGRRGAGNSDAYPDLSKDTRSHRDAMLAYLSAADIRLDESQRRALARLDEVLRTPTRG